MTQFIKTIFDTHGKTYWRIDGFEEITLYKDKEIKSVTFIYINCKGERVLRNQLLQFLNIENKSCSFKPYTKLSVGDIKLSKLKKLIKKQNTKFILIKLHNNNKDVYYSEISVEDLKDVYNTEKDRRTQVQKFVKQFCNKLTLEQKIWLQGNI